MPRLEVLKQRGEVPEHEAGQGVHAQSTHRRGGHLAHLVDHLVGAADQLDAVMQEGLAQLAQAHAAHVAMEQGRADEVLELADALGDHRARDAQLARRLGETARLGNANEGFDGNEAVQRS